MPDPFDSMQKEVNFIHLIRRRKGARDGANVVWKIGWEIAGWVKPRGKRQAGGAENGPVATTADPIGAD